MLSKIFVSCWRFFSKRLSGHGACSKGGCGCGQYEEAGNNYCNCGHSYEDHW